MSGQSVYISFDPDRALPLLQPIYNGMMALQHNIYTTINIDVDDVDLRQIEASDHFIAIIYPEGATLAIAPTDRLYREFAAAIESQRNKLVVTPRDFTIHPDHEKDPVMQAIAKAPRLRVNMSHIDRVAEHLNENFLNQPPGGFSIPAPSLDAAEVEKRRDEAHAYAQQATIRLNTEKRFLGAVSKIRRGLYEEALHDLDMVIAENRQNENAYLQRGRVLRRMGHTTAALRDYEQATNLSPKMVAAHIGRGELLLETERYQQAVEAFEAALGAQETSAPALAGLALTYYAMGNTQKSHQLWGELIQRDDNYGDADWVAGVFDWPDGFDKRAVALLDSMA